jgi:hypothetical protein
VQACTLPVAGFLVEGVKTMSRLTYQGSWDDASRWLYQRFAVRDWNAAIDQLNECWGDRASLAHEWFRPLEAMHYPQPLDDSFSDRQTYRRPTSREANSMRFQINLWAAVDIRRDVHPQVADGLRRMAQFLIEQAAEVDAEYLDRGDSRDRRDASEKASGDPAADQSDLASELGKILDNAADTLCECQRELQGVS